MPTLPDRALITHKAASETRLDERRETWDADKADFIPEHIKAQHRPPPGASVVVASEAISAARSAKNAPPALPHVSFLNVDPKERLTQAREFLEDQLGDAKTKFGQLTSWAQSNPVLAGGTFLGTAAIGALLALTLSGGKKKTRGGRGRKNADNFEKRGLDYEDADLAQEFAEFLAELVDDAE